MKMIVNREDTRAYNGGRTYTCPWKDYSSTSYWKAYSHAVAHAYRKGYFAIPIWLIRKAFGL